MVSAGWVQSIRRAPESRPVPARFAPDRPSGRRRLRRSPYAHWRSWWVRDGILCRPCWPPDAGRTRRLSGPPWRRSGRSWLRSACGSVGERRDGGWPKQQTDKFAPLPDAQVRVVTRAAVRMSSTWTPSALSVSRMSLNTGATPFGSERVRSAVNGTPSSGMRSPARVR